MRVSRTYTADFRTDAVALVQRGDRSLEAVARDLGVSSWTLRNWRNATMKNAKQPPSAALATAAAAQESAEQTITRLERDVRRLERENAELTMDREILKKAAAFFAKESE